MAVALPDIRLSAAASEVADAAMRGDLAAVRALVANKADVNAPQGDGATALHWAAYRGNREMLDVLLRRAPTRRPPTAPAARRCGWRASTATPP